MNRREFLQTTGAAFIATAGIPKLLATLAGKAPFRVLYNNDATNILSCTSPWHAKGAPFRPSMIEATVDEAVGVDAHFIQPGLGWVPLWPSKEYPVEEHYRWLKDTYGVGPDSFGKFALGGGDLVKIFVDRCRARGQAPFVSFRVNDIHHKDNVFAPPGTKLPGSVGLSFSRFYIEHPEWRIGKENHQSQLGQNWAIPEVRAHKLAFITELCAGYDIEGLELDFLRFYSLFPLDKTTTEQRAEIVTGFIRDVRAVLDRTAREGRRRWLCARIPCWRKAFDPMGIDLPAMVKAGLDMVNVSASYFTMQHSDFAAIRKLVPEAAVYDELCHTTWTGPKLSAGGDTVNFRRTTPEQYQTTAHLAYSRGGGGVSLFNFAYYREHGGPGRGPFSEPPFEVLKRLGDREWLAKQPQHWFLAPGWNNPFTRPPFLPRKLEAGQRTGFALQLAAPQGGWKKDARLRLQTVQAGVGKRIAAKLNDAVLVATDDVSEPFPNPYPPMLASAETLTAWTVPQQSLIDGMNRLEFTLSDGTPVDLSFIDLGAA